MIKMKTIYHKTVLLHEAVEGLNINPKGIYVDVTFGGGGHSRLILEHLDGGKLYAFDQDENAHKNSLEGDSFKLINTNFRHLKNFLRMEGVRKIDGLLADLGVSSHQFDVPERGFSIRFDGVLDMRMNTNSDLSAKLTWAPEHNNNLLQLALLVFLTYDSLFIDIVLVTHFIDGR